MSDKRMFVDSNIWLYAFISAGDDKHRIAAKLIKESADLVLSSQVVAEVCVNMLKKAGRDEFFLQRLIRNFHEKYEVVAVGESVELSASGLRGKYSLSFWDSMICAAALDAGCATLISEDMHHGLVIEGSLEIMNPFK